MTPDLMAHATLRIVQPPGMFRSRARVGFLVLGDHTAASAHLASHSPPGYTLVTLARTWRGTVEYLATTAMAIAAPAGRDPGRLGDTTPPEDRDVSTPTR